jgi:hypothetical protein
MNCARLLPATALVSAIVCVSLSLPGCKSSGEAQMVGDAPPAAPVQHPLLENIPLPTGFKIVPEHSVARLAGSMRVANCEFEGSLPPDAVARFYVEYMPTAKFTLRSKRFENGEYAIRFESDTEECNVRIIYKSNKSILLIDLGPLGKGGGDLSPTRR